jgi:hypothetical protein
MARLCGVFVDRATARDALARRQFGMVFDGTHQQIERVPRMLLDKFELREFDREVIDVVAVLHLVEAVGKPPYPCPQIWILGAFEV